MYDVGSYEVGDDYVTVMVMPVLVMLGMSMVTLFTLDMLIFYAFGIGK